jgi:SnoaL-like polyketide cyclase
LEEHAWTTSKDSLLSGTENGRNSRTTISRNPLAAVPGKRATMSTMVENAMRAVQILFTQVFRDGQFDLAEQILARDFRFQYPFPGFSPGTEGIVEFSKLFHAAFPKFELEIHDLWGGPLHTDRGLSDDECDVRIGIRWTFRGTHQGDFLGVKPSSKYATFTAIGEYGPVRSSGGSRLAAGWLELDTLGLLQQLRVVSPITEILPRLGGR